MKRPVLPLVALAAGLVALALWLLGDQAPDDAAKLPSQDVALESGRGNPALSEGAAEAKGNKREAVKDSSANGAAPLPGATLTALLMSAPDRIEPFSGTLQLSSISGERRSQAAADAEGHVQVPAGTWRIEADDATLHADPEVIAISGGESRTLLLSPRHTLKLRIVSTGGTPIDGAIAEWKGRGTPTRLIPGMPVTRKRSGHSGPAGWVTFDDDSPVNELCGELKVTAKGFEPGIFLIDASRLDKDNTCVLLPSPAGAASPGALTFVAHESGEPVADVHIITHMGELPGASDGAGLFELPSWLEAKDTLEVRHATLGASDFTIAKAQEDGGRVELTRNVTVTITPGTKAPGTLVVLEAPASQGGVPKGPRRPALSGPSPYSSNTSLQVALPVGRSVLALAIAQDGSVHRHTWRVQASGAPILLERSQEEVLELTLIDASGAPVPDANVKFSHRVWGEFTLVSDANGLARVPDPERVESLNATRGGRKLASLQSVYFEPGEEISRAGRLELPINDFGSLTVRVQDEEGKPLPGMDLGFFEQDAFERYLQNPALEGALPTAHPAWSRPAPAPPRGTTDASGLAQIQGILPGTYRVDIDLATARDPGWSPYSISRGDFKLGPPWSELVLTVPAPLFVHLRARDAATGAPIAPLALHTMSRVGGRKPNIKASTWLGWLNPEEGPFRATVPGFEALELTSQELKAEPDRDLALWPTGSAVLEIHANPEVLADLEGQRIKVEALRPVSQDQAWFKRGIWSGEALVQDGKARLPLAFEGEYTLKPIEFGARAFTFEPADFTWQGEARIQADLSVSED